MIFIKVQKHDYRCRTQSGKPFYLVLDYTLCIFRVHVPNFRMVQIIHETQDRAHALVFRLANSNIFAENRSCVELEYE